VAQKKKERNFDESALEMKRILEKGGLTQKTSRAKGRLLDDRLFNRRRMWRSLEEVAKSAKVGADGRGENCVKKGAWTRLET